MNESFCHLQFLLIFKNTFLGTIYKEAFHSDAYFFCKFWFVVSFSFHTSILNASFHKIYALAIALFKHLEEKGKRYCSPVQF